MRKHALLTVVALFVAAGTIQAQPKTTHESVVKDFIKIMEDATAGLNGIKDKASLEKATKLLKDQTDQLNKMTEEGKKLDKPSDTVKKDLDAKYGKKAEALGGDFAKAAFGVADKLTKLDAPQADKDALLKNMEGWGKAMEGLAKVLDGWGV
jgi:ABC-type phosphate transport system auxiliary subunit